MNHLRKLRPWVWLAAAVVAFGFAAWLLLIPRSAVYYVDDDGHPYDVRAVNSSGRSDQMMSGPFDMADPTEFATSIRIGCGTAFTTGEHPDSWPGIDEACSQIETPRRITGISLTVLGVAGLVCAFLLPQHREPAPAARMP
jgi:hypothetical protein